MPSNTVVKNSLVIGGLSFLGYMAGGKLGSMLGAVIGTVFCSIFIEEEPMRPQLYYSRYEDNDEVAIANHHKRPFYPPRPANTLKLKRNVDKQNDKLCELPKCSICLEPFKPTILLLPCSHMCFCDDCYDKVRRKHISTCPICRLPIEEVIFVGP